MLAKLSLLQPLYSGAVKHQKVIDQLNISAKSIAYTDAKLELMFQLFNSYINILQLHNEIASLSAEHDLLSKQLEQAEIGYAVGTVSSIDLIEIKAALATNNATVMEIKVQLDNAYLNLQQITQMEVKQIAELRSNYALPQLDLDRGLEYWQEQADKNNLALQSQRLIVSIAQKQSEFTRAKYFPTVNLSAGTQVGQNYVDGKFRDTKANSISVSVDYLLYGSGKKQADYGKSLMLMQSQQELLNKQSKSLRVKVEQQFNSLEPQQKLIEAREINVKAQLDRFRATEIGVRNGVRNQTELLAAQRSLYQSEAASKQAVYQYLIKHVSFLRSTGKLSQEALLALVNSVMSE